MTVEETAIDSIQAPYLLAVGYDVFSTVAQPRFCYEVLRIVAWLRKDRIQVSVVFCM